METRTAGSASGLEKRTSGNADTALQADSTYGARLTGAVRLLPGHLVHDGRAAAYCWDDDVPVDDLGDVACGRPGAGVGGRAVPRAAGSG